MVSHHFFRDFSGSHPEKIAFNQNKAIRFEQAYV